MRKSLSEGFTLVEILIVVAIMLVLSVITLTIYSGVLKTARLAQRTSDLKTIESALELYHSEHEAYPVVPGWQSECDIGGLLKADDVIPGLVPKYLKIFPSDPQMKKLDNASCYMYISTIDGSGYKLIDYHISEFSAEDYLKYRALVDPARDGGSESCRADGSAPEAWGFYTYNACAI